MEKKGEHMNESNRLNEEELEKVAGGQINSEQAWDLALGHANISDSELKGNKKCRLNFEYGKAIYEIEFHANGFTYAYDIDASSGRLIKTSQEIWD